MSLIDKIYQIERLDNLIRRKATGTPSELAEKLELSERQVYNVISCMKDMGAPIYFCFLNQSYSYHYEVKFSFGFKQIGLETVSGGRKSLSNYTDCNFISVADARLGL